MSATEQMRAMLDGLMGTARDGSDSKRQHLHFTNQRVCRAFLLDCCPHDIFASTKLELGECPKVHDPALRADYLLANRTEDYMYELSAMERLQTFVYDADKKTDYLKRKLAETQEELTAEETSKLNKVHELTEKLGKKLAQVEKAEADEDAEAKQKFLLESERIKKERSIAEAEYRQVSRPASSHQQQNLRVCDICSAYLGINDNDSRLADHYGGKLHLGFITVREKLEELKKICAEKRIDRDGELRDRPNHRDRTRDRDRDRRRDKGDRIIDRDRERDRERERERERERDRERDRERERDRIREERYRDPGRERDRSRSSSRFYPEARYSRPRDHRYKDERIRVTPDQYDRDRYERDRLERSERLGSASSSRTGARGVFDRVDSHFNEREMSYQKRLREWEKREAEKARKHAIREKKDQERKLLEEQESRKLKEFLEDYKDDRDDIRFYRGSALARRLEDRRAELEQDEMMRHREKIALELLSKSYAVDDSSQKTVTFASPIEEQAPEKESAPTNGEVISALANDMTLLAQQSSTSSSANVAKPVTTNSNPSKSASSEEKRKQVEELIGRIPTDKDQLFAHKLDWSLLDDNLMEKRIRPWVTKKIAEYMGEKEVELIDFVCTLLNAHTDGASMLREVAVVLDDEAEKFVVHMWRLLIFELEAKKIGLRK